MRPQEITIAQTLKAAGYSTGQFGKWHLGDSETHPIRMGFDRTISSGNYYDNGAIGCRTVGCLEWSARFPKPIRTSLPAVQMDMYPTALAAAGVNLPDQRPIDGQNIMPLLERNAHQREKPIGLMLWHQEQAPVKTPLGTIDFVKGTQSVWIEGGHARRAGPLAAVGA
jgi:arylsulfatase A-like enzyme